jgi:hypothetical protein
MRKYPRTPHVRGSRLQPGDEDLAAVPFEELRGKFLIIEEKIDGANCGVSFDETGALRLQSRGHYLEGGPRERQFDLLKMWANSIAAGLFEVLGQRYVMYGEWMYAKHTVFYDQLPHYFLEFDVLDRESGIFLSTAERRRLLDGLPLASVPVLREGANPPALDSLVVHSLYKSQCWKESLDRQIQECGQLADRVLAETDSSSLAEGLYIKWEEDGEVKGRYKFVRSSFLTAILDSGSHWQSRPILPNLLREGSEIFG